MIQPTSYMAYQEVKLTLGERQHLVLETIKKLGEASNLDLAYELQLPINRITPRTNELVKIGKVVQSKKAPSKYTGKTVIYWKLAEPFTGQLFN